MLGGRDLVQASQVAVVVENLPANAGNVRDAGLIPGLGRSSGGRHGHPLQYSCLENLPASAGVAGLIPGSGRSL